MRSDYIIGTPNFLPAILAQLRQTSHLSSVTVDQLILQSLLICIIARDSHLIIRTSEEDVGLVVKLVVWTLTSVFNYPTHRLKIRPKPAPTKGVPPPVNPSSFLRSLFLPASSSSSSGSTQTSQDESSDANRTSKHVRRTHSRSHSHNRYPHTVVSESARPIHHSNSDSSTKYNLPLNRNSQPSLEIPRALVISGLENANASSQRALAEVLSQRKIPFDNRQDRKHVDGLHDDDDDEIGERAWDLPDDFILVYVCPTDPCERPNIHKTLLDKFAMSSNISIKPSIRNMLQFLLLSPGRVSLSTTHSASQSNPSTPLASQHINLPPTYSPPYGTRSLPQTQGQPHSSTQRQPFNPTRSHSGNPISPPHEPTLSPSLIQRLRETHQKTFLSSNLSLYLADLFTATRHHPQLDGTWLTARSLKDAEKLARAARVMGVDPTGMELLRPYEDHSMEGRSEELEEYDTLAIREASSGITIKSSSDKASYREVDLLGETMERDALLAVPTLDVTEVNMARMFPRCVSHRLRVRDGPREEVLAGAVFGATFGTLGGGELNMGLDGNRDVHIKPSVKDILVGVMAEVLR